MLIISPMPVRGLAKAMGVTLVVLLAMAPLLLALLRPATVLAAEPASCPAEMVLIPGGNFRIGAGAQLPEERPAGRQRLSPFCIGVHEITNREFAAFVALSVKDPVFAVFVVGSEACI